MIVTDENTILVHSHRRHLIAPKWYTYTMIFPSILVDWYIGHTLRTSHVNFASAHSIVFSTWFCFRLWPSVFISTYSIQLTSLSCFAGGWKWKQWWTKGWCIEGHWNVDYSKMWWFASRSQSNRRPSPPEKHKAKRLEKCPKWFYMVSISNAWRAKLCNIP